MVILTTLLRHYIMEYNKNNKKIDEKGSEKILKTKAE